MVALKNLLDLVDKFQPEIAKAFQQAIANIKSDAVINLMVEALKNGDINAALRATGISEAAMRPLVQAINRAFEAGGVFTADQFRRPVSGAKFRFDISDLQTAADLRDYSSQLVTRITDDMRTAVRNVLSEAMAAGQNPLNTARSIVGLLDTSVSPPVRSGGIIGLSDPQTQWVKNMREDLNSLDERYFSRTLRDRRFDSTVQKAIDSGTPLDSVTVDNLTTRYSNNLLVQRGETIGRTEAISALNKSQQASIQQAIDAGGVDESSVTRIWDAAEHTYIGGKGHTRKTHVEMDGQEVGMNEPFVSPSGARMMYPGDTSLGAPAEETINCRCRLRIKIDFLKGLRGTL